MPQMFNTSVLGIQTDRQTHRHTDRRTTDAAPSHELILWMS